MKSSNIGGQAVMEGIMMRHGDVYSVGVRKPDGEIEVKIEDYRSVFGKHAWMKWPLLRGVVSFVDSLVVGTKCLMYSASFYEDEEEEGGKPEKQARSKEEEQAREKKEQRMESIFMYGTVFISLILSVGLFMVLPYWAAQAVRLVTKSDMAFAAAEAAVRIMIFMAYLVLISRMKDIQRVFMYHGAEHKCINCVENGWELNVENVMKSSRQHKRCGTSFLLFVMVVSVIIHFGITLLPIEAKWMQVLLRIVLLPLIAGISYEFIRWAGSSDEGLISLLSKPGLALQKLTTREPQPDMAEVAIRAVEAVFDWRAYLAGEEDTSVSGEDREDQQGVDGADALRKEASA